MTKVTFCSCNNKFQDRRYGKGQRLHNEAKTGKAMKAWRCTVCGNKKE